MTAHPAPLLDYVRQEVLRLSDAGELDALRAELRARCDARISTWVEAAARGDTSRGGISHFGKALCEILGGLLVVRPSLGFVLDLYVDAGVAPDARGVAHWLRDLERGDTRSEVRANFVRGLSE